MKTKTIEKVYPKWYKKIRRLIINLYRPILHDKSKSLCNQPWIAYIMFSLSIWTLILVLQNSEIYWIPFMSGWIIIPITWIYLKLFPQTWDEMYLYEKISFRHINKLPPNWAPSNIKFGSEGRISGKRHSTK
jgi:hypothetical protein